MGVGVMACALVVFSSMTAAAAENGATAPAPAPAHASPASSMDAMSTREPLRVAAKRPVVLSALYASYASLQVLDVVSTRKALSVGAHEVNPIMGGASTGRMMAVKVAGSSAAIFFAERMWKKNRVSAIVTMAVVNGLTAAVVSHNARVNRH